MSNGLQKFLLTAIILVVTISTPMIAQDNPLEPVSNATPFYFGPVIGYNRVLHSATLSTFKDEVAACPVFENGSANGYFFGLSFEYLLGDAKNSKSSIIARLLYNSMPASFEAEGDEYPSVITNKTTGESELITSTTKNLNEVIYDMITFEAQYKLNLFETTFGLIVGPTFDFALTKDHNQTLELLEPKGARFAKADDPQEDLDAAEISFSEDGRTLIVDEGEIPNSNALRVGIKFGVQYEIILNNGFYIVPSFNYNFGVTNLSSEDDWRVSALQLGVDIRFPSTSIF